MVTKSNLIITGCKLVPFAIAISAIIAVTYVATTERWERNASGTDTLFEDVEEYVIKNLNPENIRSFLRNITKRPHLGGTEGEKDLASWIASIWKEQGLDEVHLVPYQVLLSYPSPDIPNLVHILDDKDHDIWTSQSKQRPLYAEEESSPLIPFTFNAYAASGNVKGDVVYAHYGQEEDFRFLETEGINITGKIVLARYGRTFRGNIAKLAESRGAIGLVLFSDPMDSAPEGPEFVYPKSYFMPPSAVQLGNVKVIGGDPLTPFYPAVESAFRIPLDEAPIPKIPVQPIGYGDAWHILSRLGGAKAPASWQGGLNVTYNLGPGFMHEEMTLNLEVHNQNTVGTTHNVIGVLRGAVEPDRYVILGNHIDAWLLGAVDPNSGTAAMLEISRVLMQFSKETGWRPRRSIIFCGWGAEEHGLIASVEWTEQFGKQLADRTVAYLNVDKAVAGNYTFRAKATPLLKDALLQSARKILNPNPDEVAEGRKTIYDTWALRKPNSFEAGVPRIQSIGSGSDFKGFQHNLGIPSMDVRYTHDSRTLGEPLYHTLYETFALVDEIYDRGFHYHKAVAAFWADIALVLSEAKILPFSLDAYAEFICNGYGDIMMTYGDLIASKNITLDFFTTAVQNFNSSVVTFGEMITHVDHDDPLALRKLNDQLMMVERAFIDTRGLPGRPEYNHVVNAPSQRNKYAATSFAGLSDTLASILDARDENQEDLWRTFLEHLAAVTHLLNTAAKVLTDDLW